MQESQNPQNPKTPTRRNLEISDIYTDTATGVPLRLCLCKKGRVLPTQMECVKIPPRSEIYADSDNGVFSFGRVCVKTGHILPTRNGRAGVSKYRNLEISASRRLGARAHQNLGISQLRSCGISKFRNRGISENTETIGASESRNFGTSGPRNLEISEIYAETDRRISAMCPSLCKKRATFY